MWDTFESDGSMTGVRGVEDQGFSHMCETPWFTWEGGKMCKCVRVTCHMWLGFSNPLIRIVQMIKDVIRWGTRIN